MDPNLGLLLKNGMFADLPPNATTQQLVTALNAVIAKLNQLGGIEVFAGVAEVPVTANIETVLTVSHGLGFTPGIEAYLNNIGIDTVSSDGTLTLPLPSFLGLAISGGAVVETARMFCLADDQNIYFYSVNGTGRDLGIWNVTYYLKRQLANQI